MNHKCVCCEKMINEDNIFVVGIGTKKNKSSLLSPDMTYILASNHEDIQVFLCKSCLNIFPKYDYNPKKLRHALRMKIAANLAFNYCR